MRNGKYECYLEPHTKMPMMYIEDCLNALFQFLNVPNERLRRRVYNVTAMSFTPEELFVEIKKYIPDLQITYKPDSRQLIGEFRLHSRSRLFAHCYTQHFTTFINKNIFPADSWPQVFDDSEAREDWGWQHKYGIDGLVSAMIRDMKENYVVKNGQLQANSYVWLLQSNC